MTALTLQLPPNLKFTDEEFEQIVPVNKELRLELTAERELVIMSPTGGETGNRNFDLLGQLWFWNSQKNLGLAFDSSTGFKLPNGATRSQSCFLGKDGTVGCSHTTRTYALYKWDIMCANGIWSFQAFDNYRHMGGDRQKTIEKSGLNA